MARATFAIKTRVDRPEARRYAFAGQKTMYDGKRIAVGDRRRCSAGRRSALGAAIFFFGSENEGGSGLVARGVVGAVEPTPRKVGIERQTPRASIVVERTALRPARPG